MPRLTYQTAGESHGPSLICLVDGLPQGLEIDTAFINTELSRRQGGYGRGGRQRIESDQVEFLSGVRLGRTIGSPIAMRIPNRDSRIDDLEKTPPIHQPRPGHADLAGSIKWLTNDCRQTLERASARETAARVAAGALARLLLRAAAGIEVFGFVRAIGRAATSWTPGQLQQAHQLRDASEVYCPDATASQEMMQIIRQAKIDGDTLGGICEAHVIGCPPGLGTCVNWNQRLDARLAGAVMGIQAFKGVEIGLGFEGARRNGSQVHDPIAYDPAQKNQNALGFTRPTNHAGGLEGGMTNGMPIVVRGAMKPIATLLKPLPSVDLRTGRPTQAAYERSDVCAVPAASVVMENVVAFEVAAALLDKFPGDTMRELQAALGFFLNTARDLTTPS